jgi:hypothetical protein
MAISLEHDFLIYSFYFFLDEIVDGSSRRENKEIIVSKFDKSRSQLQQTSNTATSGIGRSQYSKEIMSVQVCYKGGRLFIRDRRSTVERWH